MYPAKLCRHLQYNVSSSFGTHSTIPAEHTTGGAAPFCDGEAEQSEDEAVSSDEDMDDDGAAMSVEEVCSIYS